MALDRALSGSEARALSRLGAAGAAGDSDLLCAALADLAGHVPADGIEELLLQTAVFAGYPRAINAFYTWQGWASRAGLVRRSRGVEPPDPEEWRRRGEELCRLVYGGGYEALQERLGRLHPALAEWTLVEGYGKILSRPGIDPARRELAATGALIALRAERQLRPHLRGAVHAGAPVPLVADAAMAAAAEHGGETWVADLLVTAAWAPA